MRSRRAPRPTVALVTSAELRDLSPDDRRFVVPALNALGVDAVPAVWTEPPPPCDAFVIRSPWDYVSARDAFLDWLDRAPGPVWNDRALVRWNTEKTYLLELESRGVPIVPTVLIPPGGNVDPEAHGFAEAVAKPTVSVNALGARRMRAGERFTATTAMLLQPFLHEVVADGERSFVFVEGELTHVLVKRPAAGDYRVQEAHGGVTRLDPTPPAELCAAAARVLGALPATPLYARVDGVVIGGELKLMELEATEPYLYFDHHPPAARTFAEAVARRLQALGA